MEQGGDRAGCGRRYRKSLLATSTSRTRCHFPIGLVGGMVLPGMVAPELPGTPVPAPLEVPLLPLLPAVPPMLLPELSGMLPEEPDMPEAPVPALPDAPELSGMLPPPELLPLLPMLLPDAPDPPDAPELPAERPDIELHAASAHTHATSVICFIMKFLLGLKDTAHMQPLNWRPSGQSRRMALRYLPAHQ